MDKSVHNVDMWELNLNWSTSSAPYKTVGEEVVTCILHQSHWENKCRIASGANFKVSFILFRTRMRFDCLGGKEGWQENKGGAWEGYERDLWPRDKVGRETSQSGCQDQSVLSWRFNVMEQCFLVQDNGEWVNRGGKKRENLQDQSFDWTRGESLCASNCLSLHLASAWDKFLVKAK